MRLPQKLSELAWIVGSGISLAIPFILPEIGWMVFVCAVPYLLYLQERKTLSYRKVMLRSFAIGIIFFGVIMTWLLSVEALRLISTPLIGEVLIVLAYMIIAGTLATSFLLVGWFFKFAGVDIYRPLSTMQLGIIWGLSEVARSAVFSVVSAGNGALIGPHWGQGSLAYPAATTHFGFLLALFGLALGGGIVLVLNCLFCMVAKGSYTFPIAIVFVLGLAGILSQQLLKDPSEGNIDVALVSLEPNTTEAGGYQQYIIEQLQNRQVDALIMPEYGKLIDMQSENDTVKGLDILKRTIATRNGIAISSRTDTITDSISENIVTFVDQNGNDTALQPKQFLVPGGEFVPNIFKVILQATNNQALLNEFDDSRSRNKSPQEQKTYTQNNITYGVLACSGVLSADLYRDLAKNGANILVNPASISTLGGSQMYYDQTYQMAVFHARANNRTFIQSSRGGYSFALSQDGSLLGDRTLNTTKLSYVSTSAKNKQTLYTKLNDWVILLLSGVILVGLSITLRIRDKLHTLKK